MSGKPHLGTDRLVKILRNARAYLVRIGCMIFVLFDFVAELE